jgi:superfamily I DNA and RNA helicase
VQTSVSFLKKSIEKMGGNVAYNDPNIVNVFLQNFNEAEFKKYDVVIIDEAQDILTNDYLLLIDVILKDGLKDGSWAIFLDSAEQTKVFGKLEEDALGMVRSYSNNHRYLKKNRRNSPKVVTEFCDYLNIQEPECLVESPGNVIVRDLTKFITEDSAIRIEGYLKDIILENQLDPKDLIVLSPSSGKLFFKNIFDNQYFSSLGKTNKRLLLENLSGTENGTIILSNSIDYSRIEFCNIHAFKGMEKTTAILIWDKQEYDAKSSISAHLFYTALTRVLNEVYILLISQENKAINFNE